MIDPTDTPPPSALDNLPDPESEASPRPHRRGFTAEQMLEVQRIAQELATQQLQRVVVVTGNFIITLVAVLSSALGLATALAWRRRWPGTKRSANGCRRSSSSIPAIR